MDAIATAPHDRFWSKVDRTQDCCWLWQGHVTAAGYGKYSWRNAGRVITRHAHRVAYVLAVGPIPDGLTVDHLCFVTACCNPTHLRLLTNSENAQNQRSTYRTHCDRGHEFTEGNTKFAPCSRDAAGEWYRARICRTCANETSRRSRRRQLVPMP